MNTWNTLPERYQQRMYKHTLATVKHHIQQPENPTPVVVISMNAAPVDNTIHLEDFTSKGSQVERQIGSTDLNIQIKKIAPIRNCMSKCQEAAWGLQIMVTEGQCMLHPNR
jgi:hypothetical protein